jgi:hypothetical protein
MATVEERLSSLEHRMDAIAELRSAIGELCDDMNRRFEQVDRRFEHVDHDSARLIVGSTKSSIGSVRSIAGSTTYHLVPIVPRLVGSVHGHTDVVSLVLRESRQLHTEMIEMQPRNFLIQLLGQHRHRLPV